MSNFPLYDTLYAKITDKDLSIAQKSNFMKQISSLDSEAHELVYALIKTYFINENRDKTFCFPYEGKVNGVEIKFCLEKLPFKLRQLLYKFILLHNKKLKEDAIINEIHDISSIAEA